jgi:hypothetical protein
MGWTYSSEWRNRAQLVEYLTSARRMGSGLAVLRSAVKPSEYGSRGVLWTVVERKADGRRFIGCDLLDLTRFQGVAEWGYKDMDESCGPNEINCPAEFLELVPAPDSPFSRAWRERVREAAGVALEQRAAQLELMELRP